MNFELCRLFNHDLVTDLISLIVRHSCHELSTKDFIFGLRNIYASAIEDPDISFAVKCLVMDLVSDYVPDFSGVEMSCLLPSE